MANEGLRNLLTGSDEDSVTPVPGEVIAGKYRVDRLVGRGGMGVVLSAQHVALGQTVAIKVLSTAGLDEARTREASARFLREGQSAARLTSDHVVRIYDVGTLDSGAPFMVMELLRGEDLATLLERQGPAPVEVAIEYVLQACDAVAEAHTTGIVHRDLKPSNLFVSRRSDGRPLVKVLDFGISKAMNPAGDPFEGSLTETRSVVGSPYYMSPEQVRDAKRVDARTDIWSLGMILYELLTGEPAFNADTLPGICAAIAADAPVPIRERRPDVPPEVEALVMRCLEKDPAKRFQSVSELSRALAPFAPSNPRSSTLYAAGPVGLLDSLDRPMVLRDAETIGVAEPGSGPRRSDDPVAYALTDPPSGLPNTLASALGETEGASPPAAAAEPRPLAKASRKREDGAEATLVSPSGETGSRRAGDAKPPFLFVGAAAVALAIATLAVVLLRPAPTGAPPSSSAARTTRQVDRFAMTIDSTPSGANVFDGDTVIGTTPFTTVVDNASVASSPRKLTIRLDGYEPQDVVQGPSATPVHLSTTLVRLLPGAPTEVAAATVVSRPEPPHPERSKPAPKSAPHRAAPAPTPAAPSDIRLER